MTFQSFNKIFFFPKTWQLAFLLLFKTFFLTVYFHSFHWAATQTAASAHITSEWTESIFKDRDFLGHIYN